MQEYIHIPVMTREVSEILDVTGGGCFVDCTLGLGGHSEMILSANPANRLLGIDRDVAALDIARERLFSCGDRARFVHCNFKDVEVWCGQLEEKPKGILVDLGLSSLQLQEGRGFSFKDGMSLDMRMDTSEGQSAAEMISKASEEDLIRIFKEYGEVERAYYIAKAIIERRNISAIESATALTEIIKEALPPHGKPGKTNPATKVFQAIRIAVNRELEGLGDFLRKASSLLASSGRIIVISYHSLEDRIAKTVFRELEKGCICPPKLPVCGCGHDSLLKLPRRSAMRPKMDEVLANPSSRSARLRYAVKI
jgi:16S rRNA (cytosine1402-N4)-methyltransferase